MEAGYPQRYRKDTLCRCLRIYDKMVEEDTAGTRPLYRPKDYDVIARRREKQRKLKVWSNRGGYIAPIFVPTVLLPQLDVKKETACHAGLAGEREVTAGGVE